EGPNAFDGFIVDAAGNIGAIGLGTVQLDTLVPTFEVSTPSAIMTLRRGDRLTGRILDSNPSGLVTYTIGDGPPVPVHVDSEGRFDRAIDLSGVAAGATTLSIHFFDAAGNVATETIDVTIDPDPGPLRITHIEPRASESSVGVTFRPRIRFSQPIDLATVTPDSFFATVSGEIIPTNIVLGDDNQIGWLFHADAFPGSSRITVTVDGDAIRTAAGERLDADGDGVPGGVLQFDFSTGSTTPVLGTALTGVVLDPGPDNLPHTDDDAPLSGVEVFFLGAESDVQMTDADGRFTFDSVPVGNGKIAVNGLTVTPFDGVYFPEMVMDAAMQPAKTNFIMPGMETLYLPRVETAVLETVNNSTGALLIASPEGARQLPPQQRELLTLQIPPDSLLAADGSSLDSAEVGISTVPPALVVDMLPPGVLRHTFDITIQALGVANFANPAPLTFPNVFDAAPGTQLNFLSFDHTTGLLVIEGTATVSADGR
ncbi:MAG: Ig-like domain-containing protein, partial [Planctomycetota bacterium]